MGVYVDFVQPLPIERRVDEKTCIADWTLVVPLAATNGNRRSPTLVEDLKPVGKIITAYKDFETYAGGQSTHPEGLVLFAHHNNGSIWFNPENRELMRPSSFHRVFKPGSFAALLTCELAELSSDDSRMKWLDTLNRAKVDAAIVSIFDLPLAFGERFTVHLSNTLEAARQSGEALTVSHLFRKAAESLLRDRLLSRYANGVFELVVVGKGDLRICPK